MRADRVLPGEVSSLVDDPVFRVVLWNRPSRAGDAWFSDEWQIDDVHDVRQVIEWAAAQGSTTFEVLVSGEGAVAPSPDGRPDQTLGHVRVAGTRPDDGSTTHVVSFTSAD